MTTGDRTDIVADHRTRWAMHWHWCRKCREQGDRLCPRGTVFAAAVLNTMARGEFIATPVPAPAAS